MEDAPIKQTEKEIIINKNKVESLSQRFLSSTKSFLVNFLGRESWDRLGLENTWRFFLPLIIVLSLFLIHKAAYPIAIVVLVITGIWLYRKRKK